MTLDNFRTQKIIWDRANKQIFEKIEANSGDSNGRKLVVQVINQGVTEGLSGTTLSLGWKSRNGAKGLDAFNVVDASKGIFEIYYTTEMLSNIGNIEASLILIDSTSRIESSTFTVSVRPSTVNDESVESENSFTALTEALVKVNDFDAQLAQKASKESLGEVNQDLQSTKDTINNIIITPTEGITEQEIIEARKGKSSLGKKIEDVDTNIDEQRKQIYDHLYRFGNEYVEKTGGFIDGYKTGATTQIVTKNTDHINVNLVYSGGVANYGLVTNQKIDLTNVNTLYIDWEQTVNNASSRVAFVASTFKNQPYSISDANVTKYGLVKRELTPLDVSGLTGEHYIRIHGYSNNSSGEINYKIYQIYTDLELIDRTTLEIETEKIKKRFISTVYPVPAESEGYWTPEILERQGGLGTLEVRVRFRRDTHRLHIKPENGAVNVDVSWGDVKTQLSSNVKTVNTKEYLFIPQGNAWVYSLLTDKFFIINRTIAQPYHIIILYNQNGLVSAGEALNWRYSKYKFDSESIPDGIIQSNHLDVSILSGLGSSQIPENRREEFNDLVYRSINRAKKGSFRLLFVTDTHGERSALPPMVSNLNIASAYAENQKLDLLVHGGDVVNGYLENKREVAENLNEAVKILSKNATPFILKGNHDDNSYYDTSSPSANDIIYSQQWHNTALKQLENEVVFDSDNLTGGYYYQDFQHHKIRVVALNSIDYPDNSEVFAGYNGWGYSQRQINWLANEALDFTGKEDWQLLVLTHAGTRQSVLKESLLIPYNSRLVEGTIKAFKEGTSYNDSDKDSGTWGANISIDYSEQGSREVIAIISGHVHADRLDVNSELGFPIVSTKQCQSSTNGAFDVVTINPIEKEVFMDRFGDGEDRNFTY